MSNWKTAVMDECSGKHVVPESAGCYAIKMLYQNRGYARIVYVGTSKNLKKRLVNHHIIHIVESITPYAIILKYKVIESNVDRRVLELKLIDKLKPVINKDGK
jgi:excinuclease UvrABC nuclease subunit